MDAPLYRDGYFFSPFFVIGQLLSLVSHLECTQPNPDGQRRRLKFFFGVNWPFLFSPMLNLLIAFLGDYFTVFESFFFFSSVVPLSNSSRERPLSEKWDNSFLPHFFFLSYFYPFGSLPAPTRVLVGGNVSSFMIWVMLAFFLSPPPFFTLCVPFDSFCLVSVGVRPFF